MENLKRYDFEDGAGNKSLPSSQDKFRYLSKTRAVGSYAFGYRDLNSSA
ncbi:MAG: hypothetical protein WBD99_07255 [Thermodesulfobacteriota bacterium]